MSGEPTAGGAGAAGFFGGPLGESELGLGARELVSARRPAGREYETKGKRVSRRARLRLAQGRGRGRRGESVSERPVGRVEKGSRARRVGQGSPLVGRRYAKPLNGSEPALKPSRCGEASTKARVTLRLQSCGCDRSCISLASWSVTRTGRNRRDAGGYDPEPSKVRACRCYRQVAA